MKKIVVIAYATMMTAGVGQPYLETSGSPETPAQLGTKLPKARFTPPLLPAPQPKKPANKERFNPPLLPLPAQQLRPVPPPVQKNPPDAQAMLRYKGEDNPSTESVLAEGLKKHRAALELEEEEEPEEILDPEKMKQLTKQIKQAFPQDDRLTDDVAAKIAAAYANYPTVNFESEKVKRDIKRRIAELTPSPQMQGPIVLPNVSIPASR